MDIVGSQTGTQSGPQVGSTQGPQWVSDMVKAGGQIYNFLGGRVEEGEALQGYNYIFTSEGLIPLSIEAETAAKQHASAPKLGAMPLFEMQGEDGAFTAAYTRPIFSRGIDEEIELPPGVSQGVPEGENPDDYVLVGRIKGGDWSLDSRHTQLLYAKLLRPGPPPEAVVHQPDIRPRVVEEPEEPEEPEVLAPIVPPTLPLEPEPEVPRVLEYPDEERAPGTPREELDRSFLTDVPERTIYHPEEDRPPITVEEVYDKVVDKPQERDPLFVPNLLASIGDALGDVNLSGVSYQVPRYDQQQYASRQLGPAVQNLFRGR